MALVIILIIIAFIMATKMVIIKVIRMALNATCILRTLRLTQLRPGPTSGPQAG